MSDQFDDLDDEFEASDVPLSRSASAFSEMQSARLSVALPPPIAADTPPPAESVAPAAQPLATSHSEMTLARRMHARQSVSQSQLTACEMCHAKKPRARVRLGNGEDLYLCRKCVEVKRAESAALADAQRAARGPEAAAADADEFRMAMGDHAFSPAPWLLATATFFVRRPCAVIGGTLAVVTLLVVIATMFSFQLETGGFEVKGDVTAEMKDARTVMLRETRFAPSAADLPAPESRERAAARFNVVLYFERDDPDAADSATMFDVPAIQFARKVLANITSLPDYEKHCVLRYDANDTALGCAPPFSLLNWLYGRKVQQVLPTGDVKTLYLPALPDDGLADELVDEPDKVLAALYESQPALVESFVSTEFSKFWYKSRINRVLLSFGSPYEDFDDIDDDPDAQSARFEEWALKYLTPALDGAAASSKLYSIAYLGEGVSDINAIIASDSIIAVGCMLLVLALMIFHTRSFFIAGLGMLHILLSFPLAYFFFRVVLAQTSTNMMVVLSLFIILGVGADDIFIYADVFAQTRVAGPDVSGTLERRIAYTVRHATGAVTITSLSTACAFFANAFSVVPPIRTFGLFTGSLILANYVFCATYFVAVLAFYGKHIEGKRMFGKCCGGKSDADAGDDNVHDIEMGERSSASGTVGGVSKSARRAKFGRDGTEKRKAVAKESGGTIARIKSAVMQDEDESLDMSQHRVIERFFYGTFTPFINRFKLSLLLGFLLLFVMALIYAVDLAPATEPGVFLPPDHPLQRSITISNGVVKASTTPPQVFVLLGVQKIDRTGTASFNATDYGEQPYDSRFSFGTVDDQLQMLELCDRLANVSSTRNSEVLCPIRELQRFLERRNSTDEPRVPIDGGADEVARWFGELSRCRSPACGALPYRPAGFAEMVRWAEETRATPASDVEHAATFEAGDIVAMTIAVNTSLPRFVPDSVGRPIYDEWVETIDEWNKDGPENLQAIQTCQLWVSMAMDRSLQQTAIQGIIISLVIASVILLVATANWLVTLLTIASIVGVVVTFLGSFVGILGWKLGVIESIALAVCAGLSVDFSAHIAIAYNASHFKTRLGRVRSAMAELGVSVLMAALTTIASAAVLSFAQVTFFSTFGFFILVNILLSALWSFVFLPAALLVCGPQADGGRIKLPFPKRD